MSNAEVQYFETDRLKALSPEGLISDFQRIASARAEATHLSALSLGLETTMDGLLLDEDRNLKNEFTDEPDDDQIRIVGYTALTAYAAREKAVKANSNAQNLEESLTLLLMLFGREQKIKVTSLVPGRLPIRNFKANGKEAEGLDHAVGIIEEPYITKHNGLWLRHGNGLLNVARNYEVNIVGQSQEPLVNIEIL